MEVVDMSPVAVAFSLCLTTAFWYAVFRVLCRVQPSRSYVWKARSVSFVHGFVITLMTGVTIFWLNPSSLANPGGKSNTFEVAALVLCLGFFVFDTRWCLLLNTYDPETAIYAVHHAVCMSGLAAALARGHSGTEACLGIFLAEVSHPCFQIRWFLRELGVERRDKWYELNDLVFIAVFLASRLLLTPLAVYHHVLHPRPGDTVKFFGVCFGSMNAVLSCGVLHYALKKYANVLWECLFGRPLFGAPGVKGSRSPRRKNGKHIVRLRNGPDTFDRNYGE